MARKGYIGVQRLKNAIKGSSGIKAIICQKVPCALGTLDRYLAKHPTVRAAYDEECSKAVDACHGALMKNIQLAITKQQDGEPVSMGDIKWYLSRKGKAQGFGDAPMMEFTQHIMTLADFRRNAKDRLAEVEELEG